MPRACTVCTNPKRREIDAALAAGTMSYRNMSERFGTSLAALNRHKAHVSVALAKIAEKREESIGESIMARLEKLYVRTQNILDSAETSGDHRLALQAVREARENLAGIFALVSKAAGSVGEQGILREVTERMRAAEKRVDKNGDRRCPRCGSLDLSSLSDQELEGRSAELDKRPGGREHLEVRLARLKEWEAEKENGKPRLVKPGSLPV